MQVHKGLSVLELSPRIGRFAVHWWWVGDHGAACRRVCYDGGRMLSIAVVRLLTGHKLGYVTPLASVMSKMEENRTENGLFSY